MNNHEEYIGCDLKRELVRIVLERIQGERTKNIRKIISEPEVKSPKVKYEVEDILNNAYMNRDEVPLAMDIFRPVVKDHKELPVIVDIHGGGLVLGDRTSTRVYSRSLASRGYLVFSIEYRLAPRANACEQLDDVCAGLDLVGRSLVDFNVDFTRMFLTADSAGAYLAIYVAAMKQSEALQKAIGYEPTNMVFKALGLHSGMFYTGRQDPIGWMLADQFYGDRLYDKDFLQYLDPEHDEILKNLPPVFMTTSRGDFLNNYTLMYHDALKRARRRSHLVYYGSDDLVHAFPAIEPMRAESIDAIDKMTDYFEEEAKLYKEDQKKQKAEKKILDGINERTKSGEIIGQKSWKFIKELNSYSRGRLDSVALKDCEREYTYRQMFARWERYAEVFSALGITGDNASRVAMTGTAAVPTICAFYALNMVGTSVSMVHTVDVHDIDRWKNIIEKEHITDLVLNDVMVGPAMLKELAAKRKELGIRNIIVLQIPMFGEFVSEEERYSHERNNRRLRKIKDALFMDDLLVTYEGQPVAYSDKQDDAAVIIHTSGTTNGIHKPIPISDRGLNEAVARLLRYEKVDSLRGRAVTFHSRDMSTSYSMIDCTHMPLAFGGEIITLPTAGFGINMIRAFNKFRPNVVFASPMMIDTLMKLPVKVDFSKLEFMFIGGSYVSASAKRKYDRYLKKCGSKVGASVGYGLSEAGAACILSSSDRDDDAIGYPLPGVNVRIYNEEDEKYYRIEDGVREGVLFISSPSVSCGRIDDTVFFELDEIEGERYLNTFDKVRVNEDGSLTYSGRMNKFFINNDGIRFNAGLIETAVSAEKGIEACGLAPEFSKILYDSVPVLYVQTDRGGKAAYDIVRKALKNVYINSSAIDESNLPAQVVITDEIPFNDSGKVDVYRIMNEKVKGMRYAVIPVRMDGRLTDIRLERASRMRFDTDAGVPEELEGSIRRNREVYGKNALSGGRK